MAPDSRALLPEKLDKDAACVTRVDEVVAPAGAVRFPIILTKGWDPMVLASRHGTLPVAHLESDVMRLGSGGILILCERRVDRFNLAVRLT